MKRILMVAAVALAVVVTATGAVAESADDPEDVQGGLDIVLIKATGTSENPMELKIKTAEEWSCGYLKPSKSTSLQWKFDEKADGDTDYKGNFVCRDGTLVFEMQSSDGSNQYEPLPTSRPNKRTVETIVPAGFFAGKHLNVYAKSKDSEACEEVCEDRAPDEGKMSAY